MKHNNTGDDPSLPGGAFETKRVEPKYKEPVQMVLPLRRPTGRRKANSPKEAAMMILGEL